MQAESFDLSKASEADIQFLLIVKVPFHLRVGAAFYASFEHCGIGYSIYVQNTSAIDSGEPLTHSQAESEEQKLSTVVLVSSDARITPDELAAVRAKSGKLITPPIQFGEKRYLRYIEALNSFIIGYHTATGDLISGVRPLRLVGVNKNNEFIRVVVCAVGTRYSYWTEGTIPRLVEFVGQPTPTHATWHPTTAAFSAEKLASVPLAANRASRFYFYELAFDARSKLANTDLVGALLMAVAALEGAHAAFLGLVLAERLPTSRTGEDKTLEENYIKELGFSLCNKLTPYLFMDDSERPPWELVQKGALAIKYRNEIMHALRNAQGDYRIRTRSDNQLFLCCRSALALYEVYKSDLEKRLPA